MTGLRHWLPVGWADGAVTVNPGAGDVLADTGPLPSGLCQVQVFATMNPVGFELVFEWRNADNTATVKQKILPVTLAMFEWSPISALQVNKDDRFRVVARTAIDGEVEVSIFYGGSPIA